MYRSPPSAGGNAKDGYCRTIGPLAARRGKPTAQRFPHGTGRQNDDRLCPGIEPYQQADLERQERLREMFYSANEWSFEILTDIGSGLTYHKRGLRLFWRESSQGMWTASCSPIKIDCRVSARSWC